MNDVNKLNEIILGLLRHDRLNSEDIPIVASLLQYHVDRIKTHEWLMSEIKKEENKIDKE